MLPLATALAVAALALAIPSRAAAGEFTIEACQADAGEFASTAFEDFATRGMRWRRACDPLGPGLRGLVTSNVVRSGRVAHGAQSAFVLNAPPGTAFSRLRWSGHAQRRDCRYALQLYGERPDGSDATIRTCAPTSVAQVKTQRRRRVGPGREPTTSEERLGSSSGSSASVPPRPSSALRAASTTCRPLLRKQPWSMALAPR